MRDRQLSSSQVQNWGRSITVPSAPAPFFTPDLISGCVAWFDATALTGYSDTDTVTTWPDLTGTGDITGTGTYTENAKGSNPGLTVSSAWTGTTRGGTAYTMAGVAKITSAVAFQTLLRSGAGSNGWALQNYSSNHATLHGGVGWYLSGPAISVDSWFYFVRSFGVGGVSAWHNGSSVGTPVAGTLYPASGGNLSVGVDGAYVIGELLVFNNAIGSTDVDGLNAYFATKWGF